MKCDRCGYEKPVNPLSPFFFGLHNWALTVFLDHVTPMPGSWAGADNFWINWHWFMWWFGAIGTALGAIFFLIFLGVWVAGTDAAPKRS